MVSLGYLVLLYCRRLPRAVDSNLRVHRAAARPFAVALIVVSLVANIFAAPNGFILILHSATCFLRSNKLD